MFKTLRRKTVYQNPWIKVFEDIIERPGGQEGLYGVIEKNDFAAIIALEDDQIHLVEQYRYPIKTRNLELPMGSWTGVPDADPLALAHGELQEETGYRAGKMEKIGFHYVDNGGSTQGCHIFLATELSFVGQSLDAEEDDLIALKMPIAQFEQKIIDGEIPGHL